MNQRLQGALGALALVGAGWLMGAAGSDDVRTRRLVVEDERGRQCVVIDAADARPQIRLYDPEAGRIRASLTVHGDSASLAMMTPGGLLDLILVGGVKGHGLTLFAPDGKADLR